MSARSREGLPPRILVIDDDASIRRFLKIALVNGGYEALEAARGRDGAEIAMQEHPDAIVLDLGLPDLDGKGVIRLIREWSQAPILVLSVRDRETEKIAALDAGADDYVTKPFSTGELLARLRVLLRKRAATAPELTAWSVGDLSVDVARHVATRAGQELKLTRKEFDVLALLTRDAGRLVTHGTLLRTVWGPAHLDDVHYLRIVIGRLREKLGDDAADPSVILTEPGVGYRIGQA